MATLPGDNASISLKEINDEFTLGTSLNPYRGVEWFTDQNESGLFPNAPISLGDFRNKRKTSPVTANSIVITEDMDYTVPMFNTMTITIRGGGGGGHGYPGAPWGNPGGGGGVGGDTAFGKYGTATGGTAGYHGPGGPVSGTDGAGADGGSAGGNGYGSGGAGGKIVISWTKNKAADKSHIGEVIHITVGKGGGGGGGGTNFGNLGSGWFPLGNAAPGGSGANGSVTIDIT